MGLVIPYVHPADKEWLKLNSEFRKVHQKKRPQEILSPIKEKQPKCKLWSENSCIVKNLKEKFNFKPPKKNLLKKRKSRSNNAQKNSYLGLNYSDRIKILKMLSEKKSVKEI